MPYLKTNREHPLTRLLKGYNFKSGTDLARLLGVSVPTGLKKLNDPKNLTIGDLDKIHRFGHIPIDEIRAAIGGR